MTFKRLFQSRLGKRWEMSKEAVTIYNAMKRSRKMGGGPEMYDAEARVVFLYCFCFLIEDTRAGFFFASSDPVKGEKSVMQEEGDISYK